MITSKPLQPISAAVPDTPGHRVLTDPITYYADALPGGSLTIPVGTLSDGASIPWGVRWIVGHPNIPAYERGALLHDYMYRHRITDAKTADLLFKWLLEQNGVGWRRHVMYAALRAVWRWFW